MTLKAIERISSYNRFGSKLGLERMENLMNLLDHPEKDLKVIHVAGTNGKGSVCRYIYEVLMANGYYAGLYISPFIEVFNERMEAGGLLISDEDLSRHTDIVLKAAKKMEELGEEAPTEFEIVTAIAFSYFKEKNCDFVVLEVGLGGRGDSTNVVSSPVISVITSISYDHMDRLGNSLEEIAAEKAGIIKEGVPCVINVEDEGARRVIAKRAYEENAPLYDAGRIQYKNWHHSLEGQGFDAMIYGSSYDGIEISMLGLHQVYNGITALVSLEVLRKAKTINVSKEKVYQGMKKAAQPARFEILQREPYIILDGAHNESGAQSLEETMGEFFKNKKVLMVIGILKDKEVVKMLDHFMGISDNFIVTEPVSERAMEAATLAKMIEQRGGRAECIPDMRESFLRALEREKTENWDVVVFGGSLYLVGKIREMMTNGHQ